MFDKRILLYIGGIAICILSMYLCILNKNKVEHMSLDRLIGFQRHEDPVFINNDLIKTKEWTCDRRNVLSKDRKPYRWRKDARLRLQAKTFRDFEVDQILLTPIESFSPVILYLTSDKGIYDSIIQDAKKLMAVNKEGVQNGEPSFDFMNAEVAIQAASAGDHFSILVMNRSDYDKGLKFN